MAIFERQAVEVVQGILKLYLTYVTPRDLFNRDFDFYNVEKLDPEQSAGYQRILEPRRSRRLARHMTEAFDKGYANLPTTIFLATKNKVEYDHHRSKLRFETDDVCPFSVVDGQHRIAALEGALKDEPDLWDFKLPATMAVDLDDTHQMYHFFIVNTTQKPVDRGLAQQITSRFTRMQGVQDLPYLPHWYRSQVDAGTDDKALRIVQALNEDSESPYYRRVRMANDDTRRGRRIAQASLVNTIKDHVLTGTNPLSTERDIEKVIAVVGNYLKACEQVFVPNTDRDNTIAWSTSGIWFLLLISKWVFSAVYASTRVFSTEGLAKVLKDALGELDEEYAVLASERWWRRGEGASGLNRASARGLGNGFLEALDRSRQQEITL